MKPEYILEEAPGKSTLYHLKVKDSNNLMAETNLFFDLKEGPTAYDSFIISQSDDEYIHNFKGLIIEPSNLSVDINVDVSSKISILKADQGVLGKEGLSVVELPDEPVTLLINKELDFKASDHAGIFFNQDSKVEIDRLSFERNTEFSLLYIAPVKKLSSLYIKDANFSTIYAKSPIKEMSLQDFNKDSKVVANLYIEADKSNKVINKVEAFNASFDRLSNADNIVKAKIGVNKELELINTTINGIVCPSCGFTIDRDTAAAINLREEMERYLIGIAHPEFTLVERSSVDDRSLGYLRSTFSMKQEDSINLFKE